MMSINTLHAAQTWLVVCLYLVCHINKVSPESSLVCDNKDLNDKNGADRAGLQFCARRCMERRCHGVQTGNTRETCRLVATRCYKYGHKGFKVLAFYKMDCGKLTYNSTNGLCVKVSGIQRTGLNGELHQLDPTSSTTTEEISSTTSELISSTTEEISPTTTELTTPTTTEPTSTSSELTSSTTTEPTSSTTTEPTSTSTELTSSTTTGLMSSMRRMTQKRTPSREKTHTVRNHRDHTNHPRKGKRMRAVKNKKKHRKKASSLKKQHRPRPVNSLDDFVVAVDSPTRRKKKHSNNENRKQNKKGKKSRRPRKKKRKKRICCRGYSYSKSDKKCINRKHVTRSNQKCQRDGGELMLEELGKRKTLVCVKKPGKRCRKPHSQYLLEYGDADEGDVLAPFI